MIKRLFGGFGITALMVCLVVAAANIRPNAQAADLSNVSPNPGDMFSTDQGISNPPQQAGGMSHMLKWETVAQVRSTSVGVYYDTPGTSSRNITLTDGSGNGDSQCLISSIRDNNGGANEDSAATATTGSFARGDTYVRVRAEGAPGSVKQWDTPIRNVCSQLFRSYPLDGITLDTAEYADTGKYKLSVTVSYSDRFGVGGDGNWHHLGGSLTNSFNFKVNAGPNAIIGALQTDNSQTFGLRSSFFRGDPPKGDFFKQQWGLPCDATNYTDRAVKLYDPDINVFGDTFIKVTKNGTPLDISEYNRALDTNVDYNGGSFYNNLNGSDGWIRVTANSGVSAVYVKSVTRGATYKTWVFNPLTADHVNGGGAPYPPNGNVLSINIPNDSIYGENPNRCNYRMRPTVSVSPGTYSYYPNLNVDASVGRDSTNGGSGPMVDSHTWQVYAVRYASEPATRNITSLYQANSVNPCTVIPAGGSGCSKLNPNPDPVYPGTPSASYTYTSGGPDPLGTLVCFFARVQNPSNDEADDTSWAYSSTLACSRAGIKPKIQAWGYDTKATGRIKTSLSDVAGMRYGSWGEYGILSNNRNIGMASGNGLLGGAAAGTPQGSWSPLTFANDSTTVGFCGFGCYGGVTMPLVSTQGAAVVNGNLDINSYAQLAAAVGSSKGKLRVNGIVRITGPIVYPDSTSGIAGIPKIQIIANDIVIDNAVGQVDPWLIAIGTTGSNGRISTCTEAQQAGNYFIPMQNANLYGGASGICTNPIKFNSPLIADKVYLYRTYDEQDGARAAETLNVRADNFLSSYVGGGTAQPVAVTESVRELPPRF